MRYFNQSIFRSSTMVTLWGASHPPLRYCLSTLANAPLPPFFVHSHHLLMLTPPPDRWQTCQKMKFQSQNLVSIFVFVFALSWRFRCFGVFALGGNSFIFCTELAWLLIWSDKIRRLSREKSVDIWPSSHGGILTTSHFGWLALEQTCLSQFI